MTERNFAELVIDVAARDAINAWIEGGEEYAIDVIERHVMDNARSIGEAHYIRDGAMDAYRAQQVRH